MSDARHLEVLQRYWKDKQAFPSIGKLCPVLGIASKSGVFKLITRLCEAGYLDRIEGGRIAPTRQFFSRPVLGSVRAGAPEPADQADVELLSLDDYLIERPDQTSLYRVRGDSMRDAGLLEGDLVITERQVTAQPGDIVVACVDGEFTVKTLRQNVAHRFYLEPANPAYADIHPQSSLDILGVVVGSVRKLRR